MKYIGIILLLLLTSQANATCVILLHGLARSDHSMKKLERALLKRDFIVVNKKYASRKGTIETLARQTISPALKQCPADHDIHFVTHSMGGILVRQYLSQHNITKLKRVVMLGPPNKGSEVVDKLEKFPGFHFMNGDAGLQLGTGKSSIPNKLGKVKFDLGVIAGNKSVNWILSSLIPGKDDGKVSIEKTKVEGMKDHITMPVTHTFMMRNKKVINQVIHYLENGSFIRKPIKSNDSADASNT